MVLLEKITIKPLKLLPFSPHYGKLPYFLLNANILCFQKYVKILSFPKKRPNDLSKRGSILQFLE